MKWLKGVTIVAVAYAMLYCIGAWILKFTEMSYREWVKILWGVTTLWILPLLGIIWSGVLLKRKNAWNRIVKVILMLAEAAIYVCWMFFAFWGLVMSVRSEKMLAPNLLITNESGFLEESHYIYYRPVCIFFKIPGELTAEDGKEYLERKYDREFEIDYADGDVIYDKEFPNVRISVELMGPELEDDFVGGVLIDCLTEGVEVLRINREYYISDFLGLPNGIFHIQLRDESDIPELAEDISKLIEYVCERTSFFQENRGYLYFYCGEIEGPVPFGKLSVWDEMDSDYYLYPEKVEAYIQLKYDTAVKNQKEYEEWQKEFEENLQAQVGQEPDEEYIDPIEANAKIIYDAVLAEQGYSYEVCYNAKGNLYLDLGSRPAGEAGDQYHTGTYRFTLVYDRTSKNGACELYVLYKEHYAEEEGMSQSDGTAILDMYAVEVDTGRVVAADKQGWSDVATREYRELTGE